MKVILPDGAFVTGWTPGDLIGRGSQPQFDPRKVPGVRYELEGSPIPFTGLDVLLAELDDKVEYLVADRIAFGSVNLLAGKPKAGKSTAARALAFSVARGEVWLGFQCLSRPVWYLALEEKRSEVRRHFRTMGADGGEPIRFLWSANAGLLDRLHELAGVERPGLIVVDTLQRLINADDLNNYAEVTTKLNPVLKLARETGAAVLLVHHAGKADRASIDSLTRADLLDQVEGRRQLKLAALKHAADAGNHHPSGNRLEVRPASVPTAGFGFPGSLQ